MDFTQDTILSDDTIFYGAGYQGKKPEDLAAWSQRLGGLVYDIRLSPASQQPGWNKAELQSLLGGSYRHVPTLGNRNYKNSYASGGPVQIANLEMGLKIVLAPARLAERRPALLLCRCPEPDGCHRAVVAQALRERGYAVQELNWGPSDDKSLEHDKSLDKPLRQMTAAEFCQSNQVLRVFSHVLGEEVIVAPDDWDLAHPCLQKRGQRLVYWASEIAQLDPSAPEFLRSLHEVKRVFGTESKVIVDESARDLDRARGLLA